MPHHHTHAAAQEPTPSCETSALHVYEALYQPDPPRPAKSKMAGLMAMTALAAGACGWGYGGHSSYATRNDPDRQKTPEDLERMTAAQSKRERKAAKHNSIHGAKHNTPARP